MSGLRPLSLLPLPIPRLFFAFSSGPKKFPERVPANRLPLLAIFGRVAKEIPHSKKARPTLLPAALQSPRNEIRCFSGEVIEKVGHRTPEQAEGEIVERAGSVLHSPVAAGGRLVMPNVYAREELHRPSAIHEANAEVFFLRSVASGKVDIVSDRLNHRPAKNVSAAYKMHGGLWRVASNG